MSGKRRADVFSQIPVTQKCYKDEIIGYEEFASDILISLHQTIIIILDSNYNQIAFWGPSNFNEQYGVRSIGENFIDTNVLSLEDLSTWKIQIKTVFKTGESLRSEYPLYLPLGEFWFDMVFSPIWGPKGDVSAVLVMIRDITLLKERVNELLGMYHDLQLYTSLLRHDLSNDVQVILTETEVSEFKETKDTDLMQMRETVKASAERMARVLNAFSTDKAVEGLDILQLIRKAGLQAETIHQNLRVYVKNTNNVHNAKVSCGRLLPMVFDNLLRNAAQHSNKNPIVRIMVTLNGREVQIDIRDNGNGIPHELRKAIFENENGRNGLSLCKRIIEGCGGALVLLDNQNHGTAFRITLPLTR